MKLPWKVLGALAALTMFLGILVYPTHCGGPGLPPLDPPGLGGAAVRLFGMLCFWGLIALAWLAISASRRAAEAKKTPEQRRRENEEWHERFDLSMAAMMNDMNAVRTFEERKRMMNMGDLGRAMFEGEWEKENPGWRTNGELMKKHPGLYNRWRIPGFVRE